MSELNASITKFVIALAVTVTAVIFNIRKHIKKTKLIELKGALKLAKLELEHFKDEPSLSHRKQILIELLKDNTLKIGVNLTRHLNSENFQLIRNDDEANIEKKEDILFQLNDNIVNKLKILNEFDVLKEFGNTDKHPTINKALSTAFEEIKKNYELYEQLKTDCTERLTKKINDLNLEIERIK